ncbi:threonine--tRNA ligase [Aquicella lusitana]|uniref:Threonine--tRNA ligase n=1 Tax=Aquicella lusitana TaxID=254246 RepID=A0A370H1F4_9COXI|nr:threonine--tRNA ligase [Aquicella lusitana]RDI48835.1 threonyl-tRNA synthetase [Aquicella lusitana]VVC73263.1 Threonine--tRNA ligase [Aquicella lusitana]
MPVITLPDGTQKHFDAAVTVQEIAASIGSGLAKAAIAGKVNGKLVDTFYSVGEDAEVRIITDRDPEGLEIIRHSTAHLLAHAVKSLFPSAQVTIGPVIENGFYYDFAFDRPFSPEDLELIEAKMQELAEKNYPVSRRVVSRDEAIQFFSSLGEDYKVKIIEAIPEEEILTIYQQGDFADLCRGPHVPSTGMLKAFKLTKLSGAYWRGDSNNEMLQRIYGTAWKDKKALDEYLKNLEEAEKRDHRKLAKSMDLFHMQEEAPGMVFWHPNGWTIYQAIKSYISSRIAEQGYEEVVTPQIVDVDLWKKSGHLANFSEEMFTVEVDEKEYAIKPMNCPCHVQIFKQGLKSYRDLPLRLAEFGCVHRNEMTGAMHGLMRVRQLVQDDAHIFCSESQIQDEASKFIRLVIDVYKDFGFNEVVVRLATRPEKRIGTDESWDRAEHALAESLRSTGLSFEIRPGEGGFYGPKIEFHLKDCLGRMWQCGTLQLDYNMPERLEAYYIAEDGSKKTPVMLHRAILGSLERFIGILLEHYAGKLPVWLTPVQAMVMNITDKQADYVEEITRELKKHGVRAKSDLRNEKIGFKIREHTIKHVPYLLVVGDREVELRTVSVRAQGGADLGSMPLGKFIAMLDAEVAQRGRIEHS